jgi:ABC-2 type transport system ATP-binding protein
VADLCTNMAIIANGEVLHHGQPLAAIESVRGKTWKKVIEREQLERHQRDHQVISTRLFAGRTLIHVLAEARPDESFMPVEPGLEDVYFTTLARSRGRADAKSSDESARVALGSSWMSWASS